MTNEPTAVSADVPAEPADALGSARPPAHRVVINNVITQHPAVVTPANGPLLGERLATQPRSITGLPPTIQPPPPRPPGSGR